MTREFWIGIDGGGTKTTAVIGDGKGYLLAVAKGSSGNLTAISPQQLSTLLQELIEQLLKKTGVTLDEVKLIFAALAGADRPGEQQKIYEALQQSSISKKFKVKSDIHAALAAGTWGKEGTLLIAGTGAILFGYEEQKTFRVGGWGYLLGDEGSGYHLGKLAIRSILKAHDKQLELKPFQQAILHSFHVTAPEQLITTIYSSSNPVAAISSTSKLILMAYEEDETARAIVHSVQEDLLQLIEDAYARMNPSKPVILHGGLFSNQAFFKAFENRITKRFPDLIIKKPTVPAMVGAYLLALHESEIEISELVKQTIQRTWRTLEGEVE